MLVFTFDGGALRDGAPLISNRRWWKALTRKVTSIAVTFRVDGLRNGRFNLPAVFCVSLLTVLHGARRAT